MRSFLYLCAAAYFAVCVCALAGEPASTGYERDYYGTRVPVFQCGLLCAATCLGYYGVSFDYNVLKEHLPCSEEGTSLLAVQSVLEAYGMAAEAVRSLSVRDLEKHLKSAGMAIVLLKSAGKPDHFVSVVRLKGHSFVCVDAPSPCYVVDSDKMKGALVASGGVALLISRRSEEPELDEIQVTPEVVDLGDLTTEQKARKAEFAISNKTNRPVVISGFRAACGCMDVKPSSKWLEPGGSCQVECLVFPDKWGTSETKTVYANFAGGGVKRFQIKAKGRALPGERIVVAAPETLYVDDGVFGAGSSITRKVVLRHVSDRPFSLAKITASEKWVRAAPLADSDWGKKGYAEISLVIDRTAEYGAAQAVVNVVLEEVADPVTITVRRERAYPFEVLPRTAYFVAGGEKQVVLHVRRLGSDEPFEVESAADASAHVTTEWQRGALQGPVDIVFRLKDESCLQRADWIVEKGFVRLRDGELSVDLPVNMLLQGGDYRGGSAGRT